MRRPSLVGQLLTVHLAVVAASCVALVCFALVAGAKLLRTNQEEELAGVAGSLCHDLVTEMEEGMVLDRAVDELFREWQLAGHRVELMDSDGTILAGDGTVPGWSAPSGAPVTGRCYAVRASDGQRGGRLRTCTFACAGRFAVRVVAVDFLHHRETMLAALGILMALPMALGVGWIVGWALFRRRLRPLTQIRDAAAALEPGPSIELGVGARAAELADLEKAFNGLLERIGAALERERRFSGDASHELRTPLTVLRGRLDHLAEQVTSDPVARADLDAAVSQVASLDRLIDALLLLSRSDSAPFAAGPVNVCDVARDVARRQAAADGTESPPPEVEAPDEILVRGSEDLLDRALGNLVDNARRYAGPLARIRIRVTAEGGMVHVRVEDDGPGISAEIRPFVFDSFVRGPSQRSRTPGTGLGLAIVRAIARRHGGEVTAHRADGGGEEVRIQLPLLVSNSTPSPIPGDPRLGGDSP